MMFKHVVAHACVNNGQCGHSVVACWPGLGGVIRALPLGMQLVHVGVLMQAFALQQTDVQ
jgi:hypothetical protein